MNYSSRLRSKKVHFEALETRRLKTCNPSGFDDFPDTVFLESDSEWREVRSAAKQSTGNSVDSIGDFDGDGYEDFVARNLGGEVIVHFGGPQGALSSRSTLQGYGRGVISGGHDINGDGLDDFVIVRDGIGVNDVTLVYGDANRAVYAGHVWSGYTTATTVSDVNGDGLADIALAHTRELSIVFGTAGDVGDAHELSFSGSFGSISDLGDLDGNGTSELGVQNGSNLDIYSASSLSSVRISKSIGGNNFWHFTSAGDFNDDGFDDFIIGGATPRIYFGGSDMLLPKSRVNSIPIQVPTNGFHAVGGGADINGDGLDDIVVGNHNGQEGSREAFVFFGTGEAQPLNSSTLDGSNGFRITGYEQGNSFSRIPTRAGYSVDIAHGDGDGVGDVILGLPGLDTGNNHFGADVGGVGIVWGRLGAGDDTFEENDTFGNATRIPLDQGPAEFKFLCYADPDIFEFTITEDSNLKNARIDFQHSDGDLDLLLIDGDGEIVEVSLSENDNEVVDLSDLLPGDYYLVVDSFTENVSNSYSLTLTVGNDQLESNDSFANATELGQLTESVRFDGLVMDLQDIDVFHFELVEDVVYGEALIEFSHADGDVDVLVYNEAGEIVAGSLSTNDNERLQLSELPPGGYYLVVATLDQDANAHYSLELEVNDEVPCREGMDHRDIDALFEAIRNGETAPDLNGDRQLDVADVDFLVGECIGSLPGDVNLDQQVNFQDFLILSENFGASGGWSDGDFGGDGDVGFEDFLQLSENFGKSNR